LYLFAYPSFTDLIGHEKSRAITALRGFVRGLSTVDGDGEIAGRALENALLRQTPFVHLPAPFSSGGNLEPDQKIRVTENSS
jgi:hypothetical protein